MHWSMNCILKDILLKDILPIYLSSRTFYIIYYIIYIIIIYYLLYYYIPLLTFLVVLTILNLIAIYF